MQIIDRLGELISIVIDKIAPWAAVFVALYMIGQIIRAFVTGTYSIH